MQRRSHVHMQHMSGPVFPIGLTCGLHWSGDREIFSFSLYMRCLDGFKTWMYNTAFGTCCTDIWTSFIWSWSGLGPLFVPNWDSITHLYGAWQPSPHCVVQAWGNLPWSITRAQSVDALGNQCQLLHLMLPAQRFVSYICLVAPFEYQVGNGPSVVGSVKPNLKF